jgi:hypothetical protein
MSRRSTEALINLLKVSKIASDKQGRNARRDASADSDFDQLEGLSDLAKIGDEFLKSGNPIDLRDRTFVLLCAACCLRGASFRSMSLAELGCNVNERFGQNTRCPEVRIILTTSKRHRSGEKPDKVGCIRHRSVNVCPVRALALYLFSRFQNTEVRPLLEGPYEGWANIKLACNNENPTSRASRSNRSRVFVGEGANVKTQLSGIFLK